MRPATLAVHAGRDDFEQLGVHTPPLDLSSTYPIPDLDEGTASLDALASGDADAPNAVYSRLRNPTVARFEGALAQLEGTETSVAFASGMAAMTTLLESLPNTDTPNNRATMAVDQFRTGDYYERLAMAQTSGLTDAKRVQACKDAQLWFERSVPGLQEASDRYLLMGQDAAKLQRARAGAKCARE